MLKADGAPIRISGLQIWCFLLAGSNWGNTRCTDLSNRILLHDLPFRCFLRRQQFQRVRLPPPSPTLVAALGILSCVAQPAPLRLAVKEFRHFDDPLTASRFSCV